MGQIRLDREALYYFVRDATYHPLGVLLLLAIQWYAIARAVIGRPVGWKGRTHPTSAQQSPPVATGGL
jgi:hypothetical protein